MFGKFNKVFDTVKLFLRILYKGEEEGSIVQGSKFKV